MIPNRAGMASVELGAFASIVSQVNLGADAETP